MSNSTFETLNVDVACRYTPLLRQQHPNFWLAEMYALSLGILVEGLKVKPLAQLLNLFKRGRKAKRGAALFRPPETFAYLNSCC